MPDWEKRRPPGEGKRVKRRITVYIIAAIAVISGLAAWAYFKGGEAEKPVAVVRIAEKKPSPPPVTEESFPQKPEATIPAPGMKKEVPPTPVTKQEAAPSKVEQVQEKKKEELTTGAEASRETSPESAATAEKGETLRLQGGQSPMLLHVSSFREEGSAMKEVQNLRAHGYPAFTVPFDIPSKGIWYRVFGGRYASLAESDAAGDALKKAGLTKYFESIKLPYSLQVGVFSTPEDAARMEKSLNLLGYPAVSFKARSGGDKVYYRVLVGAYQNEKASTETAARLRSDGFQALLITP